MTSLINIGGDCFAELYIEQAATMPNPRAYIDAVIRGDYNANRIGWLTVESSSIAPW